VVESCKDIETCSTCFCKANSTENKSIHNLRSETVVCMHSLRLSGFIMSGFQPQLPPRVKKKLYLTRRIESGKRGLVLLPQRRLCTCSIVFLSGLAFQPWANLIWKVGIGQVAGVIVLAVYGQIVYHPDLEFDNLFPPATTSAL